jgi:hypothetical protein
MRLVYEARACSVLRNLLWSIRRKRGVFLLPANVCPVVPLTFLNVDRDFEFVDIGEDDLALDSERVQARLERRESPVLGVLHVRTYGALSDRTRSFAQWKRVDPTLMIIDDRCLCVPEIEFDAQGADVVLFSTGYGKYVDLGYGGYAALSESVAYHPADVPFVPAHAIAMTRLYQRHTRQRTRMVGTPACDAELERHRHWIPAEPIPNPVEYLASIQARLREVQERKARLNAIYRRIIPSSAQLGSQFDSWRFQVRVGDKTAALESIFREGHFASGHYYPAPKLFGGDQCANTAQLHDEIVNLFNDLYIEEPQAKRVAEILTRHDMQSTSRDSRRC